MGYDIVRFGPSDIEALFDLQTRSDISEYGEPDSELSDLQHEWAKINLEQDAWVVRGDPGKILAYGAIVLYQNDFRFDVYVDPKQRQILDLPPICFLAAKREPRAWPQRNSSQVGPSWRMSTWIKSAYSWAPGSNL